MKSLDNIYVSGFIMHNLIKDQAQLHRGNPVAGQAHRVNSF